jgi:hypothetical protein
MNPNQLFIILAGMLVSEYPGNRLLQAILDARAMNAIPGYAGKLYGSLPSGEIREFDIAARTWSAPLAQHPLGPQAIAKTPAEQRAEALAMAQARGVQA